jgi:hypothetical protein
MDGVQPRRFYRDRRSTRGSRDPRPWCGWNYLVSTAAAVEAAVLHNFAWHQRWTWRDRRPASAHETLGRLLRFHALNGAVSLAGNVRLRRYSFDRSMSIPWLRTPPRSPRARSSTSRQAIGWCSVDLGVGHHAHRVDSITGAARPRRARDRGLAALRGESRGQFPSQGSAQAARPLLRARRLESTGWRDEVMRGGVNMIKVDPPALPTPGFITGSERSWCRESRSIGYLRC